MDFFSKPPIDEDKPQIDPIRTEDELTNSINERGTSSSSKKERSKQQNAVSEAYHAALQEQAHDQAQLETLYQVFHANAGSLNPSTSTNLHKALQALARQGPDPKSSMDVTSTLIKSVARLMDDHLQQLTSSHENEMQELNKSLEFYKDQNQLLEIQLAKEGMQHQLHINNIVEEVRKQIPEDEHQRRLEVEKYQNQLKNKGSKLKALREEMRLMELRIMNIQKHDKIRKEENGVRPSQYAKVRAKAAYFQSQVSALSKQLHEAKLSSMEAQLGDHANSGAVKHLQEEATKAKKMTHKLATQLAQYRHNEKKSKVILEGNSPPLLEKKPLILEDSKIAPEEIIQAAPHIHTSLELGFGEKGFKLGSLEDTLTKKIENLQTKFKKCRNDLKESEESRIFCEKMMQDFKKETHQYRLNMLESNDKLHARKQKVALSMDCMKIKKLLENLEEVENENTELQKVIKVRQETTINELQKEVIKFKRLCFEMGKKDVECNIHEYDFPPMKNTTILNNENEVLQLKFDRDQAIWKLSQLERRMHILFGVAFQDRRKIEVTCEYFIPPTTAPHAFAGRKLIIQEPNAISLIQEFTKKTFPIGSSPREKELEGLVEGLLRIIEKKRQEVVDLQETCHDTIKHIERGKQLQQRMDELRGKLWNNDECCQSGLMHHNTIADLKNDVEKLTQLNSNLMHFLKEMENSYIELQEKFHEATKNNFSPKRRCSFNEEEQHSLSDLEVQAQEISRLQKEMGEKSQTISDLKSQLEARDDELDYLHGQLAIQEALENEHDEKITKEQMAKDNTNVDKLSLEDLQMANEELSKVCDQYEELLERQAEQLRISFEPLRNV